MEPGCSSRAKRILTMLLLLAGNGASIPRGDQEELEVTSDESEDHMKKTSHSINL
jgi:hypothetical protein